MALSHAWRVPVAAATVALMTVRPICAGEPAPAHCPAGVAPTPQRWPGHGPSPVGDLLALARRSANVPAQWQRHVLGPTRMPASLEDGGRLSEAQLNERVRLYRVGPEAMHWSDVAAAPRRDRPDAPASAG